MAGKKLFMAVDLGTSFVKTGVYDLEGKLHAGASEAVKDERPGPGMFIQRGDMLYSSVLRCLKKTVQALGEEAADVCAMAFTGQMAGSIGVDETWGDVTGWSCTMDSRYLPYADKQREEFADEMFSIGGTNAPVMCSKYDWFKNDFPAEHARIAKYLLLNGYMIGRMSKQKIDQAKIDATLITWTGLADIANHQWSEKLCKDMGVDMALLPEITSSTTIGGQLEESLARELGLKPGLPLVMGAGDKVSGCVGAAVLGEGEMIFEASSYGAISCLVDEARLDAQKRNYDIISAADGRRYYAHKYIQGSGIVIDWFAKEFFGGETDMKAAFRKAEELAAQVTPGSEHLVSIGLLSGSAMPFDSEVRGMFLGHSLNHTLGHFYRALLEGFSYDLALTLRSICAQYPQYGTREIKLIGGGAKSSVWPQMLADVTGHTFRLLDRDDVALWGAALLAAAGVGALDDLEDVARRRVQTTRAFIPREENTRIYAHYIEFYEHCMHQMHDLYARLNRLA